MALAIDASTPAIATQTSQTTATVQTASFTPPAGSLLVVRWAANSDNAVSPSAPSITDSLGVHLTYGSLDWQSRADSPGAAGQAASWWAIATGAALSITVTNGAASPFRSAAVQVTVYTGHDAASPIGAHGKSGSLSAASIAQSYTAQRTGSQGLIGVCDWDVTGPQTAGTGCALEGSASITTDITYGYTRRTNADGAAGANTTLNVTLPGTSTNLVWVYVEVLPAVELVAGPWTDPTPGLGSPTGTLTPQVSGEQLPSALPDFPQPPTVVVAPGRAPAGVVLVSRVPERIEVAPSPPEVVVAGPGGHPAGVVLVTAAWVDAVTAADAPPRPTVLVSPVPPRTGVSVVLAPQADPVVVAGDTVIPPEVVAAPARPRVGVVLVAATPGPQVAAADAVAVPVVQMPPALPRPGVVLLAAPPARVEHPAPPEPLVLVPPGRARAAVVVVPRTVPAVDAPAPAAVVVLPPSRRPGGSLWLVTPRADPPVAPVVVAPRGLVVAAPVVVRRGVVWVWRSAPPDHECFVFRPDTGQLLLPETGLVARPDTGTVALGGGVVLRPYTGVVENEC